MIPVSTLIAPSPDVPSTSTPLFSVYVIPVTRPVTSVIVISEITLAPLTSSSESLPVATTTSLAAFLANTSVSPVTEVIITSSPVTPATRAPVATVTASLATLAIPVISVIETFCTSTFSETASRIAVLVRGFSIQERHSLLGSTCAPTNGLLPPAGPVAPRPITTEVLLARPT